MMNDKIYLACFNVFDSGIEKQKIAFASFSEDKVKKWVGDFNDAGKRYSECFSYRYVSKAYCIEIEVK